MPGTGTAVVAGGIPMAAAGISMPRRISTPGGFLPTADAAGGRRLAGPRAIDPAATWRRDPAATPAGAFRNIRTRGPAAAAAGARNPSAFRGAVPSREVQPRGRPHPSATSRAGGGPAARPAGGKPTGGNRRSQPRSRLDPRPRKRTTTVSRPGTEPGLSVQ